MRRPPLAVAGLFLCVALSVGATPTFARPLLRDYAPQPQEAKVGTWGTVWDAVKQFAAFLKNGSGIDPFGQPQGSGDNPPQPTSSDNGSGIDPFGDP